MVGRRKKKDREVKARSRCGERQRARRYLDDCNECPRDRLTRETDVVGHQGSFVHAGGHRTRTVTIVDSLSG